MGDAACVAALRRRGSANKNRNAPIETEISIKTAFVSGGFLKNSAAFLDKNRNSIETERAALDSTLYGTTHRTPAVGMRDRVSHSAQPSAVIHFTGSIIFRGAQFFQRREL